MRRITSSSDPSRPRGHWLGRTITAIAAALTIPTLAIDLEHVKEPILVEVRPGGVVNVVSMTVRERQELAAHYAAEAARAAAEQQGRLIAFQVRGGMLSSATLSSRAAPAAERSPESCLARRRCA